jgi:hypothetical protein
MNAARLAAVVLLVAAPAAAQTSGYTRYSASYTVQNRATNGCGGFSYASGIWKTWICAGEERVEMRWANWPQQSRYNQWQGDINFTSGTQKTCIMQVKSNTGGEPIYLQVSSSGVIRNDNSSTNIASGMANVWFRWNALFNPANGDARAYVNGSQKVVRTYSTSARDWYFKNGTYNNGLPTGGKSTAQFRYISHWYK